MDTDQQVRLNFLEESVEYFEQMEQVLLELETSENKPQQIDIALRAAHSIKGSAGMMGFTSMSQVAHRLEDFFKILRARRLSLDPELETYLLQGVDCLKEIRERLVEEEPVDDEWLGEHAEPVFQQLHDRLGNLSQEDETRLLAGEEEVDVALLIFNNGVDEILTKFETEWPHLSGDALRQALVDTTSQLSNLGLMGEIDAFFELCNSIQMQVQTLPPEQLHQFAEQALQIWQRCQSLVQLGRLDNLPRQLNFVRTEPGSGTGAGSKPEAVPPSPLDLSGMEPAELEAMQQAMAQALASQGDAAALQPFSDQPGGNVSAEALNSVPTPLDLKLPAPASAFDQQLSDDEFEAWQRSQAAISSATTEIIDRSPEPTIELPLEDLSQLQDAIAQLDLPSTLDITLTPEDDLEEGDVGQGDLDEDDIPTQPLLPEAFKTKASQTSASTPVTAPATAPAQPPTDSSLPRPAQSSRSAASRPQRSPTLRIAAEDLRQINTLFSTLILERNTINLRQQQLIEVAQLMQERMRTLESFNLRLRQWYDRASMERLVQQGSNRPVLAGSLGGSRMKDFDALEMDQYSELHLMAQEQMETMVQLQEVTADIQLGLQDMGQATQKLSATSRALQNRITRAQMRPFAEIVNRFPRVIRDLSFKYGKKVNLRIEGETTLIERVALEALVDPLNHLLRNCFDHGIETAEERLAAGKPAEGTITIRALQRGNQAQIIIADDGRGIDLDKIRAKVRKHDIPEEHIARMSERELLSLIFDAGFSTAEKVTELSGRGVGMDVVRANVEKLKGDIQVETNLGKGSSFTITLPLSLSVLRVMLLEQQKMTFAVPVEAVTEMLICRPDTVVRSPERRPYVLWNGQQVPLVELSESLVFHGSQKPVPLDGRPSINQPLLLVVNDSGRYYALPIDRFWSEQEVAIRPIMSPLPLPVGFSGATVLGDGRVIPLVNLVQLIRSAEASRDLADLEVQRMVKQAIATATDRPRPPEEELYLADEGLRVDDLPQTPEKQVVLVIDDSIHVRRYLTLTLEKAGYEVEQAKDGQEGVDKLLGGLSVQAVLCDVEMPRLDGYGVLDEIKSRPEFASLPITMLTSRNSDKHRKLAMNLGASAYFSKPYNEQELLKSLDILIAQSQGEVHV